MPKSANNLIVVVLSITLCACSGFSRHDAGIAVGIDGLACVGEIETPHVGLTETVDQALLDQALGASGKGGICAGKVFTVHKETRVYRVWDSSKSYTQLGRWWSLSKPEGPRATYRHEYAICPSWSALDHLVSCDVKPGTSIVIGTTQSATCDDGLYQKTSLNQVYIPIDSTTSNVLVENCRDDGVWPATATKPSD